MIGRFSIQVVVIFSTISLRPSLFAQAGSVDINFDPGAGIVGQVRALALQPDGKLLVGSSDKYVDIEMGDPLLRVNADGSIDRSFNPPLFSSTGGAVNALLLQDNGSIVIGADMYVPSFGARTVMRLSSEGELDRTFATPFFNTPVYALGQQSDGKIIVATDAFGRAVHRLNTNGSLDLSFCGPEAGETWGTVYSMAVQLDDKLLIAGATLRRLLPNGAEDLTFAARDRESYWGYFGVTVDLQQNIWVFGKSGLGLSSFPTPFGILRLQSNGLTDPAFDPGVQPANAALVSAALVQPDGKVVIGGWFTNIQGVARRNIARLNRDGSVDLSFDPGLGVEGSDFFGGAIATFVGAPDGKITAGGNRFHLVDGYSRTNIARLHGDNPSSPLVLTHPQSQTVAMGQDVIFTLTASGIPWAAYQWQFNDTDLPAETNATLRLLNAGANAAGSYRAIVRNALGTATSDSATLTVTSVPSTPGSLDVTFNSSLGANAPVHAVVPQPDGKVIIGGVFTEVAGRSANRIARLNRDGSIDLSFQVGTGLTGWTNVAVNAIIQQPDGKLLVAGAFTNYNGMRCTNVIRVTSEGVLDETFEGALTLNDGEITSLALQPDGKIIVGHSGSYGITRLHHDGTIDTNYVRVNRHYGDAPNINAIAVRPDGTIAVGGHFQGSPVSGEYFTFLQTNGQRLLTSFRPTGPVHALVCYSDGRLLVGGKFSLVNAFQRNLARLRADGTVDSSFLAPAVTGTVYDVLLDECERVIIGGGLPLTNRCIARLHADGVTDTSFGEPRLDGAVATLAQRDGELLLGGEFVSINGSTRRGVARLHVEPGSPPFFVSQPTSAAVVAGQDVVLNGAVLCPPAPRFQWFADGQPMPGATNPAIAFRNIRATNAGNYFVVVSNALGSVTSLVANLVVAPATNRPGGADINFCPPTNAPGAPVFYQPVYSLAVESDGKVLAGVQSYRFVNRFGSDGALEASFSLNNGSFSTAWALAVQQDGKILIGHSEPPYLSRMFADGHNDTNYVAGVNDDVKAIKVLSSGKALVAGHFDSVKGSPISGLARLSANASLDSTFVPDHISGDVEAMAVQPDGGIVIAGRFTRIGNATRTGVARLFPNGKLDPSFDAEPGTFGEILTLTLQRDGKIVLGGYFAGFQDATNRAAIVRLHPNGRLDTGFTPPSTFSNIVYTAVSLPDDSILVGSSSRGGFPPFLRLLPNGAIDEAFITGLNAEQRGVERPVPRVAAIALHTSGRIFLGGNFTHYNGYMRSCIARLHGYPELAPQEYENGVVRMNVLTDLDRSYDLQFTDSLLNTNWTNVLTLSGDGAEKTFSHTNATASGFYRIRASSHP